MPGCVHVRFLHMCVHGCVRLRLCARPLRAGLARSHNAFLFSRAPGLKCNFIQSRKLGFFYCTNLHFTKQNEVCH